MFLVAAEITAPYCKERLHTDHGRQNWNWQELQKVDNFGRCHVCSSLIAKSRVETLKAADAAEGKLDDTWPTVILSVLGWVASFDIGCRQSAKGMFMCPSSNTSFYIPCLELGKKTNTEEAACRS
jgi:hypothetical protein